MTPKSPWIASLLNLDLKVKYPKIRLPISRGQIVHFWPANVLTPLHASFEGYLQDDDLFCHRAGVLLLNNTLSIDAEICRIGLGDK
jgi:hypothetical protein